MSELTRCGCSVKQCNASSGMDQKIAATVMLPTALWLVSSCVHTSHVCCFWNRDYFFLALAYEAFNNVRSHESDEMESPLCFEGKTMPQKHLKYRLRAVFPLR